MSQFKCEFCQRRYECRFKDMALLTLPWVTDCLSGTHASEWDKEHALRRVLRGNEESPGYVEDWMREGMIVSEDVDKLVASLLRGKKATMALLCSSCRHYNGPSLQDHCRSF